MDDNFFGYILDGIRNVAVIILGNLPHHTDVGFDTLVIDLAATTPVLLFVIVNQFIGLGIPIFTWTIILAMETIRAALAAWQWIKNALPFIG